MKKRILARISAAALAMGALTIVATPAEAAGEVTYTASRTIAVPPASSYSGSAGGDGWNVALSDTRVFNSFHHAPTLTVACHEQADASECWTPRTIRDLNGNHFASSGHSGVWYDESDAHVYTYATRGSDSSAGVVCVDIVLATTQDNPFCGYTQLAPAGQAPLVSGISGLSEPVHVGSKSYAHNYVPGESTSGARNALLCFDRATHQACSGQPQAVDLGPGANGDGSLPEPGVAAIGGRIIVAASQGAVQRLGCFDTATSAKCSGSWPITLNFQYASAYGAPFPMLDQAGTTIGFCLPTGGDHCFELDGSTVAAPPGLAAAVPGTSPWSGNAVTVGPRVFVPNGNLNQVSCFSWATGEGCPNFPRQFNDLSLLYSVNKDPNRPTCLWVNADSGQQIQNFDAYTGGACGTGAIRVLASEFVVPTVKCQPATYTRLSITQPMRSDYASGSVKFQDGDAQQIPNIDDAAINADGNVALTGKNLSTATGLPQFLIDLQGLKNPVGEVGVTLSWTGVNDPSCVAPGTVVTPPTGADCGDAMFLAVPGNGETFRAHDNLYVTRELRNLYRAMKASSSGKQISYQVIDNPVPAVDRLTAGLSKIKAADPGDFTEATKAKLASNLAAYTAHHDQGLANLRAAFSAVRADCKPTTKIVLGGYSQGALVVHEFVNELNAGSDADAKAAVVSVALLADPGRVLNSAVKEASTAKKPSSGACDLLKDMFTCQGDQAVPDIAAPFLSRTTTLCLENDAACDTSTVFSALRANGARSAERARILADAKKTHNSYAALNTTVSVGTEIGKVVGKS